MSKKSEVGPMGPRLVGAAIGLAVILLTQPASAETALDLCAYMNHESEAYAACMSDQAAAAAKTPALTPSAAPKAAPKSIGKAKADAP